MNKEELIYNFKFGGEEFLKAHFNEAKEDGILFEPTKLGVELFMWAFGHGQLESDEFFNKNITFTNDLEIKIGKSVSTKKAIEKAKAVESELNTSK